MTRIIRDFRTIVELNQRGRLLEKIDAKIAELIGELDVHPNEKARGKIDVSLTFQRIGEKIDVYGAVKMTPPPEKALPPTTLFLVEGGLSVQHPSQIDMFGAPREAGERKSNI